MALSPAEPGPPIEHKAPACSRCLLPHLARDRGENPSAPTEGREPPREVFEGDPGGTRRPQRETEHPVLYVSPPLFPAGPHRGRAFLVLSYYTRGALAFRGRGHLGPPVRFVTEPRRSAILPAGAPLGLLYHARPCNFMRTPNILWLALCCRELKIPFLGRFRPYLCRLLDSNFGEGVLSDIRRITSFTARDTNRAGGLDRRD